eukprot:scaffold202583_cov29-Tisochrysis_lutea.AAC.1
MRRTARATGGRRTSGRRPHSKLSGRLEGERQSPLSSRGEIDCCVPSASAISTRLSSDEYKSAGRSVVDRLFTSLTRSALSARYVSAAWLWG